MTENSDPSTLQAMLTARDISNAYVARYCSRVWEGCHACAVRADTLSGC